MIDPKTLRQAARDVAAKLARRGFHFDADAYLALEERRKAIQVQTEELRKERNTSSKAIGKAKAQGEDIAPLLAAVKDLGDKLDASEEEFQSVQSELRDIELGLPNLLQDDVPDGASEDDNLEVRRWGEPRQFDFEAKDHVELGEAAGMLDFDTASKMSGSRFAVMKGPLARLQRALIQFMLDTHTSEHGYTETYVPYLVQGQALLGTGLSHSDGRSSCNQLCARGDPGCGCSAAQVHGAYTVLSLGGRLLRSGHAGHDSPAPVREGGARAVCPAGGLGGCSRRTDRPCRGRAAATRAALSRRDAVCG
jgi:seryl-tRNA synthetase